MKANNAAAWREVVDEIKNTANSALTAQYIGNDTSSFLWDIIRKCEAALAAPPRNCDLGTEEEQAERFSALCNSNKCPSCPCRFAHKTDCALHWAQMPYESEVAK